MLKMVVITITLTIAMFITNTARSDDGLTEAERGMRNFNAIQRIYQHGVPHTDKHGQPMDRYDADKSFFPIGAWGVPLPGDYYGSTYDWQVLKDAGFNTVWPWAWQTGDMDASLRAAEQNDMQLIHMHPRSEAELKKMGNSERMLAHCWHDEPIGKLGTQDMDALFNEYQAYRALAKRIAPNLKVFISDTAWIMEPATSWWVKWNTTGDMSCHNNYPIMFRGRIPRSIALEPNGVPQSISLAVAANREHKPVWFLAGVFDGRTPPGEPFPFRFPTVMQLRSQIYAALIHGATGIHYFIMDSHIPRDAGLVGMSPDPKTYRRADQKTPATPMQMVQSKALWEATAEINREIHALTPILYEPTVGDNVRYSLAITGRSVTDAPIRCLLKPHPDGGYVLLTVNVDDAVLSVDYTFPKPITRLEYLFENQPPQRYDNPNTTFTTYYDPFEVHVFRIIE